MKPAEDPADRLVDALLREQHRNAADEPLLGSIETALNAAAPAVTSTAAVKRRRHLLPPLAAAAAMVLSIGGVAYWQARKAPSAQSSQAPSQSGRANEQADAAKALHEKSIHELPKKAPLFRYADLWGGHNQSPFTTRPGSTLPPPAEVAMDATPAAPEAKPQDAAGMHGPFPPVPSLAKLDEKSLRREPSSSYTMPDDTSSFDRLPSPPGALASNGGMSGGMGGSGSGLGLGAGTGMGHGFGRGSASRDSSSIEASDAEKPSATTPP